MAQNHIIVLGAGVIGLQCGLHLLRTGRYKVTIVAKHLPGDEVRLKGAEVGEYASPWAGAHWRPHSGPADLEEQGWDTETYEDWIKTVKEEQRAGTPEAEKSGLAITPSVLEWDSTSHAEVQPRSLESLWFKPHVQGFEALDCRDRNVEVAVRFTAITVNVPKYLKHLQRSFEREGGAVARVNLPLDKGMEATLQAAREAATQASRGQGMFSGTESTRVAFVNATGINARILCNDDNVTAIRGQTVLVEGEAQHITNRKGTDAATGQPYSAYAIPRVGGGETVLGGCHLKGNWSVDEDKELTAKILNWAREFCPELAKDDGNGGKEFVVKKVVSGLRPGREGGARVESEGCCAGEVLVVHAYGNGGAGYQNSVGVAQKVVRLVQHGLKDAKL